MAEHSAVNRRVVGSSPTSGANKHNKSNELEGSPNWLPLLFFNEWLFWWLLDFFSVEITANLFCQGEGRFQDRNLKVCVQTPWRGER
jgi:hypothetical protein